MGKKSFYRIKLKLRNGEIHEGFVTPPFWVQDGATKTLYATHEPGKLAFIPKDHWVKVESFFRAENAILTALPAGYKEYTAEEIWGVEVLD